MKGKVFEQRVAKYMKSKHKGGPGEPDYTRGSLQGEAKSWKIRMGKSDVMEEINKGRGEIVSKQGFTDEAVNYRNQYRANVKLFDWKKKDYV